MKIYTSLQIPLKLYVTFFYALGLNTQMHTLNIIMILIYTKLNDIFTDTINT